MTSDASKPENKAEYSRQRHDQLFSAPPRIAPLDRQEHAAEIVALTSKLRDQVICTEGPPIPLEYCPDMVPILMRHPDLWARVSSLSALVQCANAKLPARERQIAILRTTWLCGAAYQWGEHFDRTKQAGVSAEEIERIKQGSSAADWSAADAALLCAVEELHRDAFVSDKTWAVLALSFDEAQMLELMVLIGQFTSAAYLMNSLRLRLEHHNKGLLS